VSVPPITTLEEMHEFITAGDPTMDHDWFWNELGVSSEAVMGLVVTTSMALGGNPAILLMAMEFGARLALRLNELEESSDVQP